MTTFKTCHKTSLWILILLVISLSGCGQQTGERFKEKRRTADEPLIEANKKVVEAESQQIDDFILRHRWIMETTGTGLRYMITEDRPGPKAEKGKVAELNYTVTLLSGDTVYTSQEEGPLVFIIGRGQVISGIEEGILLLGEGDKAKFIIPSHLAFGLIGDQVKIKDKVSLVYDVEFKHLRDSN